MAKWEEGFYITAMAGSTGGSSLVVMSKGTPYTQQSYKVNKSNLSNWLSHHRLHQQVISSCNCLRLFGCSSFPISVLYRHRLRSNCVANVQVSDSFPFKWINKKWKEGFFVTSMATSHTRWAVVMSRNAGFIDQCVELDFQYPSEGIHRRWDAGSKCLLTVGLPLPLFAVRCLLELPAVCCMVS